MSRRDLIRMSDEEVLAFLDAERVMTCASIGRDGMPHLMPLWYVLRDRTLWAWTYARSQKAVNLSRDPRATLQVEAGRDVYGELRGVMFETEAILHDDLDTVAGVGAQIAERYGGTQLTPELLEAMRAQASKRVALEFSVTARVSWDHRKLGGTY
jgi:PPOX class probable F420-dependent enzyme